MAKKQTRRSISINLAKFKTAQRVASEIDVSLSRLCEDALEAHLAAIADDPQHWAQLYKQTLPAATTPPRGKAKTTPAQSRDPHAPPIRTDGTHRGHPLSQAPLAQALLADPDGPIPMIFTPRPTCAVCVRLCTGDHFYRLPFGKDGARVIVCIRCNDEHPRAGGYSFDGGASSSINPSDSKRVVRQGGS